MRNNNFANIKFFPQKKKCSALYHAQFRSERHKRSIAIAGRDEHTIHESQSFKNKYLLRLKKDYFDFWRQRQTLSWFMKWNTKVKQTIQICEYFCEKQRWKYQYRSLKMKYGCEMNNKHLSITKQKRETIKSIYITFVISRIEFTHTHPYTCVAYRLSGIWFSFNWKANSSH